MFGIDEGVPALDIKVKDLETCIEDAGKIAQELHSLLHEDALHRLGLYQEYSQDTDYSKWTPDLYLRCQLIERLCRKLENLNK